MSVGSLSPASSLNHSPAPSQAPPRKSSGSQKEDSVHLSPEAQAKMSGDADAHGD